MIMRLENNVKIRLKMEVKLKMVKNNNINNIEAKFKNNLP